MKLFQAFLDDTVLLCRDVGCCSDTNPAASCRVLCLPVLHVQPLCWLLHDSTQHARLVVNTFSALSVISPQQLSYTVHHWGLLLKKQVACCLCMLEQAATGCMTCCLNAVSLCWFQLHAAVELGPRYSSMFVKPSHCTCLSAILLASSHSRSFTSQLLHARVVASRLSSHSNSRQSSLLLCIGSGCPT